RRLLERLQQRIEGGLRELVDLVDDVDLVAAPCRRVLHVLAQRADLLDAAVRRPVDPEPCGACAVCREALAGTLVDVLEIDGASNRGIEEIRTLRENVKYAPARGRGAP